MGYKALGVPIICCYIIYHNLKFSGWEQNWLTISHNVGIDWAAPDGLPWAPSCTCIQLASLGGRGGGGCREGDVFSPMASSQQGGLRTPGAPKQNLKASWGLVLEFTQRHFCQFVGQSSSLGQARLMGQNKLHLSMEWGAKYGHVFTTNGNLLGFDT